MRFTDVQWPAPLSLHSMFKVQYKYQVIIIIIYLHIKTQENIKNNNDRLYLSNFLLVVVSPEVLLVSLLIHSAPPLPPLFARKFVISSLFSN